jgi:hypothetical protein
MKAQTNPRIKWDFSGLVDAVRVIFAINRNGHTSESSLESYIMSLATKYAMDCKSRGETPTMTGTGGWFVTFIPYEDEEYDYVVEVTLMSYVIAKYLEKTKVL